MQSDRYQIALIILGIATTFLFGYFFYNELFPEYKIYQDDYIALEEFRSSYTGEPPPAFKKGVKQLVFERADKGPEKIDRCISCHVAVQLPHFSSTKIEKDSQGNVVLGDDGEPKKIPNDEYIWGKLDNKIKELTNETINHELSAKGKDSELKERLKEADYLKSLKIANVGEHEYDVQKVLSMHPLIGNETRPFELHPLEEYGCTTCHSGNGRALTIDKAHGPVFDHYYEEEYTGPKPKFIEEDKDNDPRFAKIFNHKPGDSLLFQTSPILVGTLIQASCIQCHEKKLGPTEKPLEKHQSNTKDDRLKELTSNYHRGEELYISQACYACHKIAGTARGGVGPDLTFAANLYPWYMKESIVWPQADLPTSTMPNYRLDPSDVEDLMTYLLAQKGMSKKMAEIDYKVAIQKWEGGNKLPFEKSIPPSKIENLSFSMTVFATEGCAACHRLQGFESNVGFIEKEKQSKLEDQEWFKSLFYEEVPGTEIVRLLEEHETEINKRITDNVRQDSILEKIQNEYPDVIETFYQNFRYAYRAKNHQFKNQNNSLESDQKLKKWQDLVHRVLMIYIQEYGLGRLIGPKLNWSGIYRSDEWLMEHFKNPASHVPKSLMPIMPFDESKFYALTYMLDVLGKRNRNAVQHIWEQKGFSPESAYAIYCSQCHGTYLQGNGPVSQWIYPIPKNLRNAEFLKNLTRKKAIESIAHGVLGTPMAPWGEAPAPKPGFDDEPVLTKDQIHTLVDWIFTSLPSSASFNAPQDSLKWQYLPKDIVHELNASSSFKNATIENLNNENPLPLPLAASDDDITSLFDVVSSSIPGEKEKAYFINKKYYTEKNIRDGEHFFNINCATCHGADADGSGIRASIMNDAKPRMLTNFDWLNSHDDVYLLRTIKYGVPGTAMTPWGDLTSPSQRISLVVFIRSLSVEKEKRVNLQKALYEAFDLTSQDIDKIRMKEYPALENTNLKYDAVNEKLKNNFEESQKSEKPLIANPELYQSNVELNNQLIKLKSKDLVFIDLKNLISEQKDLYFSMGNDLISAGVDLEDWNRFLKIIEVIKARFKIDEGRLILSPESSNETTIQKIKNEMIESFDKQIKLSSDVHGPNPKAAVFTKLKSKLLSTLAKDQKILLKEAALIDKMPTTETK